MFIFAALITKHRYIFTFMAGYTAKKGQIVHIIKHSACPLCALAACPIAPTARHWATARRLATGACVSVCGGLYSPAIFTYVLHPHFLAFPHPRPRPPPKKEGRGLTPPTSFDCNFTVNLHLIV